MTIVFVVELQSNARREQVEKVSKLWEDGVDDEEDDDDWERMNVSLMIFVFCSMFGSKLKR